MNILQAISDPSLFGPFFQDHESWRSWRVFIQALFNLPIEDESLYGQCTGSRPLPQRQAREGFLIVGRRGGKSYIAALIAVFLACFRTYRLSPGERGVVMILATDREQAKVLFRFVKAFIEGVAMLRPMVVRETADTIELNNNIVIEIHTASYRSVRGRTLIAGICDEISFWRSDESANPDTEILAALRPAMVTVPGSMLLCISTPYARNGVLWDAYRRHFGKAGDTLVWKADTRTMNPMVPAADISDAYEADPAWASAEYGAEFRSDVESFVSQEAVDACVIPGRIELPPGPGTRYIAFCDPSGGAQDSMTLAIGHTERDTAVLDLIRERRPRFSPESVVAEFAQTLKAYGLHEVTGDKYGGEWPRERFQTHGIHYRIADKTKSEIYQGALPKLNSRRIELLDDKTLRVQLIGLERRTSRGGRDSIDHRPGQHFHDDIANAAMGCLVQCTPFVEMRPDMFAQGTISFERPSDGERTLWDQRPR